MMRTGGLCRTLALAALTLAAPQAWSQPEPPRPGVWLLPQATLAEEAGPDFGLRAARLRAEGRTPGATTYVLQLDAASGVRLFDAFLSHPVSTELRLGAGVTKIPFSASHLERLPDLALGERAAVVQRLTPGRAPGLTGRLPGLQARLNPDPNLSAELALFSAPRLPGSRQAGSSLPALAVRLTVHDAPLQMGASVAALRLDDADGATWRAVGGLETTLRLGAGRIAAEALAGRPLHDDGGAALGGYLHASLEAGRLRPAAGLELLREDGPTDVRPVGALAVRLTAETDLLVRLAPGSPSPFLVRAVFTVP